MKSTREIRKVLFITLGSIFVLLGLIGIFIPIFPTTPFLLLAAYFYARSSNRALMWLLNHRWFGVYLRNYREKRGMTAQHKLITLSLLWLSIGLTAIFLVESIWVRLLLIAIASGVTAHLLRINTCSPGQAVHRGENGVETE